MQHRQILCLRRGFSFLHSENEGKHLAREIEEDLDEDRLSLPPRRNVFLPPLLKDCIAKFKKASYESGSSKTVYEGWPPSSAINIAEIPGFGRNLFVFNRRIGKDSREPTLVLSSGGKRSRALLMFSEGEFRSLVNLIPLLKNHLTIYQRRLEQMIIDEQIERRKQETTTQRRK